MAVEEWGEEYIWGFNEEKNKPEIIKLKENENVPLFIKYSNPAHTHKLIKLEKTKIETKSRKVMSIKEVFRASAAYRKIDEKKVEPSKRKKRKRDNYENIYVLSVPSNCARHHITDKYIVPIPKEVHNHMPILQTEPHRKLMEEWMKENNRVLYNITQFIKETEHFI